MRQKIHTITNVSGDPSMSRIITRNLIVIFHVTLVAVLGVASIAPALPHMTQPLGITGAEAALLITVFTLPGIFLTPVYGVLADRYGRKLVLVPSLFLFAAAGTACGLTTDFRLLLIFRFFQGVGVSPIGSLNLTLIGDLYEGQRRFAAMGYNAMVLSFSTAIYPALGGGLAQLKWNYPFFLSVIAIPVGLAVIFILKLPDLHKGESIKGYLLGSWRLLKKPGLMGLLFASLATFILLYGVLLSYFPFFMEERFNASPFLIGIIISAASLATAVTSMNLKSLSTRINPKYLLLTAFILYAVSLMAVLPIRNIWFMLIPVLIYGAANGVNMPNVHAQVSGMAPAANRGAIMSINGMVLRLGQTLGPSISAALFALTGIMGVLIGGIIFTLLSAVVIALTVPLSEPKREQG